MTSTLCTCGATEGEHQDWCGVIKRSTNEPREAAMMMKLKGSSRWVQFNSNMYTGGRLEKFVQSRPDDPDFDELINAANRIIDDDCICSYGLQIKIGDLIQAIKPKETK